MNEGAEFELGSQKAREGLVVYCLRMTMLMLMSRHQLLHWDKRSDGFFIGFLKNSHYICLIFNYFPFFGEKSRGIEAFWRCGYQLSL